MKKIFNKHTLVTGTFLASLLCTSISFAEIVVIANKASILTTVKKSDIQRIYLGKIKSIDGMQVTPINQDQNTDISEAFNKAALNKNSNQVKAYWAKLIFTGKGIAPEELNNDTDVLNAVKNDVNTIGYVDSKAVDDSVKVIITF